MKKIDVSFWLIPVENQKKKLQKKINDLANEFKSFSYAPHVTIYHFNHKLNKDEIENIKTSADKILKNQKSISLNSLKIDYSNIFTKTLFIQFEINSDLLFLHKKFVNTFKKFPVYNLNPHLSLIYKNKMKQEDKIKIIKNLKFDNKIVFDELRIIIKNGDGIKKEKDILLWKEIYRKKFNF
ncbi:MAG: hypothetical protein Fur009_8260 [Candidatus Microgenomates bacterium]